MFNLKKKKVAAKLVVTGIGGYQQRILADNPVAYWPLDEPSGLVAKDLKGIRNGTISGGVTLNQAGGGVSSKAMRFDGSTGKISIPPLPSIVPAHTFEAWSLFNGTTAQTGIMLTRTGVQSGCFIFRVAFVSTGLERLLSDYTGQSTSSDPLLPALNTWHHCVSTFENSTLSYYIDGVKSTTTYPITLTDTSAANPIQIGFTNELANVTAITVQDVAFYTRALTQSEISAHFALR